MAFGPRKKGATGNATPADVLAGVTFSSSQGIGLSGQIPMQSESLPTPYSPGYYRYPGGYYPAVYYVVCGWATLEDDTTARVILGVAYDAATHVTLAIDGYDGSYLATVTGYSASSNTWTALADDTTARYGLGVAYDAATHVTLAIDGSDGSYLATVTEFFY